MIIGPKPEVLAATGAAPTGVTGTFAAPAPIGYAMPSMPAASTIAGGQMLPASAMATGANQAAIEQTLKSMIQTVELTAMVLRVQKETDFDGRNKVFHEYFDAKPDDAAKLPFFATFMDVIPQEDRDRIDKFFKALEAQKASA